MRVKKQEVVLHHPV